MIFDHKEAEQKPSVKLWHLTVSAGCRAVTGLVPRALFMAFYLITAYNRTSAGVGQVFPNSNYTGRIVNSLDDNDNNNKKNNQRHIGADKFPMTMTQGG